MAEFPPAGGGALFQGSVAGTVPTRLLLAAGWEPTGFIVSEGLSRVVALILLMRWGRWLRLGAGLYWNGSGLPAFMSYRTRTAWRCRRVRADTLHPWMMGHSNDALGRVCEFVQTVLGSGPPLRRPWELTMGNVMKWKLFLRWAYTEKSAKKTLLLAVKTHTSKPNSIQLPILDVFVL